MPPLLWCCFSSLLRKKLLGDTLNMLPVSLSSPQLFFDSQVPFFELDVALIFLLGGNLCCPFLIPYCLSLIAYCAFFIALSLSLSKSVSVGLSIAYLRADSCPLQSPGISVYPTRYKPVRALAKF